MLVLSRKKNESIVINDQIVITVVEVRGDKVRLGILAPRDVPVHRSEVHAAIHDEEARYGAMQAEVPVKPAQVPVARDLGVGDLGAGESAIHEADHEAEDEEDEKGSNDATDTASSGLSL